MNRTFISLSIVVTTAFLSVACSSPNLKSAKSDDADLSVLELSTGVLYPSFDPAVTEYLVSLPQTSVSLTVTGIPSSTSAILGSDSGRVRNLHVGITKISITVMAENGATKSYTVTVDRAGDYESDNIGTLKYVPAGRFQRPGGADNISMVGAFRMGRHEITRSQFEDLMGTDPSGTDFSTGSGDPVQNISWYHAIAFCNKLSLSEGLEPAYSVSGIADWASLSFTDIPAENDVLWNAVSVDWRASGYRLPTTSEWVWAAMGADSADPGGVNTDWFSTKQFAGSTGSNSAEDYAWYDANSGNTTHPAGTTEYPNELGLFDMSGNVWEWCWDWVGIGPTGLRIDYRGPSAGTARYLHGGAFTSNSLGIRLTSQLDWAPPDYPQNDFGFRVVRR